MKEFKIGDRVSTHSRVFGELEGSVIFITAEHVTIRLAKPRKKLYREDRAWEFTAHKRTCKHLPSYEIKTDEGAFKVHNHKASTRPSKEELAKWREAYVSCAANSDNS